MALENMVVKVYRLNKKNPLPGYMSKGASGIDLFASLDRDMTLPPGEYKCIPTGIIISLPAGYEAQVRPRSGLALKHGVTVLNTPGTVDSDYRGEIMVILINHGEKPLILKNGNFKKKRGNRSKGVFFLQDCTQVEEKEDHNTFVKVIEYVIDIPYGLIHLS